MIFEEGINYRLKIRRTIVDYILVEDHFYQIVITKNGIQKEITSMTILPELWDSMRMYAGYPKENTGMVVTRLDDNTVLFKGPPKKKSK